MHNYMYRRNQYLLLYMNVVIIPYTNTHIPLAFKQHQWWTQVLAMLSLVHPVISSTNVALQTLLPSERRKSVPTVELPPVAVPVGVSAVQQVCRHQHQMLHQDYQGNFVYLCQ